VFAAPSEARQIVPPVVYRPRGFSPQRVSQWLAGLARDGGL